MLSYQPLVDFLSGRVNDPLPKEVAAQAARHLQNGFCSMIANLSSDPLPAIAKVVRQGAGDCTIPGLGTGYAPEDAACYIGTAAHLGRADTDAALSAVLLGALLPLAELRDANGRELMRAYAGGLEVGYKLGAQYRSAVYERGWYATGVLGVIAAAAGCGLLLRLDAAAMKQALLISTSTACGVGANTGSSVQPFHVGWAAENGLLAARLAACPEMGASDVAFDGKEGFIRLFAGMAADDSKIQALATSLGNPFTLAAEDISLVPFAAKGRIDEAQAERLGQLFADLPQAKVREILQFTL